MAMINDQRVSSRPLLSSSAPLLATSLMFISINPEFVALNLLNSSNYYIMFHPHLTSHCFHSWAGILHFGLSNIGIHYIKLDLFMVNICWRCGWWNICYQWTCEKKIAHVGCISCQWFLGLQDWYFPETIFSPPLPWKPPFIGDFALPRWITVQRMCWKFRCLFLTNMMMNFDVDQSLTYVEVKTKNTP